MANAGYIFVKGKGKRDINRFFTPIDKGAARPAFCHTQRCEVFREDVKSMERALERGVVTGERRMAYKDKLRKKQERLKEIEASLANAKKIIKEDPDGWAKRHAELKQIITDATPSYSDEKKKRVNPHTILKNEKNGLGALRQEYKIISKALGEESNTSFLQRD